MCPDRQRGLCSAVRSDFLCTALSSPLSEFPEDAPIQPAAQSDPPFGILSSGILRSVYHGQDGRRHILSLTFPGEVVGKHLWRSGLALEAATDTQIRWLAAPSHARLLGEDKTFRQCIREHDERHLERIRYLALSLRVLTSEERLAAFLHFAPTVMPWVTLSRQGGILTLTLRRVDIADLLAISGASIGHISAKFDREGIVRILDSRHLQIPDLDRLAETGGLDPSLLWKVPASARSLGPANRSAQPVIAP